MTETTNPGGTGLEQSPSDRSDGCGDSGLTPGGAGGGRAPGVPISEDVSTIAALEAECQRWHERWTKQNTTIERLRAELEMETQAYKNAIRNRDAASAECERLRAANEILAAEVNRLNSAMCSAQSEDNGLDGAP